MFKHYREIFDQRGSDYDRAMRLSSNSRRVEFEQLWKGINLSSVNTILDVPSGGGYLSTFLPGEFEITELDPSYEFRPTANSISVEEQFKILTRQFDMIVCLASLHHISPKQDFFRHILNKLNPHGVFCFGDVLKNSKEALFLDHFVGQYNEMGHEGEYLESNQTTLTAQFEQDINIGMLEYLPCPWNFKTTQQMVTFVRTLFSLKNITDQQLLAELEHWLGYQVNAEGVSLNFNLLYGQVTKVL